MMMTRTIAVGISIQTDPEPPGSAIGPTPTTRSQAASLGVLRTTSAVAVRAANPRKARAKTSDRTALVTRLGVACDEGHGRCWSEEYVRTKVW